MTSPIRLLLPYVANLRLYTPCWEGAGTKAEDLSGDHNDGTLSGTATWNANGRLGNALEFNAAVGKVAIPRKAYLTTAPFTAELWFKLNTLPSVVGAWEVLLAMADSHLGYDAWNILAEDAGADMDKIRFAVANAVPNAAKEISSDAACIINRWYHVIATLDVALNMNLYVNAVLQAETNCCVSALSGDEDFYIGASDDGSGALDGLIDEIRFYDRVLTVAEITEQWYRGCR